MTSLHDNCLPCVIYSLSRGFTLWLVQFKQYVSFIVGHLLDDGTYEIEGLGGFGQDGLWRVRPRVERDIVVWFW